MEQAVIRKLVLEIEVVVGEIPVKIKHRGNRTVDTMHIKYNRASHIAEPLRVEFCEMKIRLVSRP